MESRTWSTTIFPLLYGFRKIALLGIPSLAVLGLAGLAGWKWMRKCEATKMAVEAPTEDRDISDSANASKHVPDDAAGSTSAPFISSNDTEAERSDLVKPACTGLNTSTCDVTTQETAVRCDAQANLDNCESRSSSAVLPDDTSKACSDVAAPRSEPGSSVAGESPQRVEFRSERRSSRCARVQAVVNIPKHLVGRFIGRQGRNVKALRTESGGAYIYVDQVAAGDGPFVPCFVHGESAQVEEALRLISYKYPNINVPNDVGFRSWPGEEGSSGYDSSSPTDGVLDPPPSNPWVADLARVAPPPSPFHGMVTYIETLKKVWILPLDAHQFVEELHKSMNSSYLHTLPLPPTSPQANVGTFCAVGIDSSHWLRGVVLQTSPGGETCDVRLVDYGSCVVVPTTSLRPLR